jgi:hypothetical protein
MRVRVVSTVVLAALVMTALALITAPVVRAAAAPAFNDPNAQGSIGFCDGAGHEVTSGSIDAAPFTWIAASSAAAPAGYAAPQGRANLYAYSPIQNVDPGDWSGKSMTAASTFTNSSHPMAAGTILDPALVDFIGAYPLHWDGLVQLRLLFSAPLKSVYSATYPAAVIRVSGHNWTLVSGGGVPCNAGSAQSVEVQRLPRTAFASASRPSPAADVKKPLPAGSSRSASASASHTTSTSPPDGATSSASTTGTSADKASGGKSSGGNSGLIVALIVIAVIAAAGLGGAFWYRWRRRVPGTSPSAGQIHP